MIGTEFSVQSKYYWYTMKQKKLRWLNTVLRAVSSNSCDGAF